MFTQILSGGIFTAFSFIYRNIIYGQGIKKARGDRAISHLVRNFVGLAGGGVFPDEESVE